MPGICGFYNRTPKPDITSLADRMLATVGRGSCPLTDQYVDPAGHFAIGRASLGILSTYSQPVSTNGGRVQAVMDGELYDQPSNGHKSNGSDFDTGNDASVLLKRFASGGAGAIAELEGSFAAAVVDEINQRLTIITDRFGTRPLYFATTPDRFLFASNIAAILTDPNVRRDLDVVGISQFFTFGHYFNDNTSLDAIKVVPSGAILTFDARTGKVSLERYWHGDQRICRSQISRDDALERIDHAFTESVRKQQRPVGGLRLGLSLSGGLDARSILGTIEHPQTEITTVCMGMQGSRDHVASRMLAHIVGCNHHEHILDTTFLSKFEQHLGSMVQLTDGQYLSQCIVMPTLPLYQQLSIGVLMRGHAGELMHMTKAYNYSVNAGVLKLKTDAELEEWLWSGLKAYMHDGLAGPLFSSRTVDQIGAARESLRQAISATSPGERPSGRISQLFLDQRVRRETMLSMMKFRSITEPRLPYLDRSLVEQLLGMPIEWRLGDELQTHILRKHRPQFCDVENTNTGAPLGAGKRRQQLMHLKMRVLSKIGVQGYQPYERLGLWLRRELADLVQAILLDEQCLDRGIFDANTIRSIVKRHLANERNHTYLIMALLVFETGHRWLLASPAASEKSDRLYFSRVAT